MKCKIMRKQVSEVKMSTHSKLRTVLAPPFYATMADTMELKVYAIVIVCLLSEACNILAMKGSLRLRM